ncbi:MAG: hypothetical protein M1813_004571 [Trichoglossum hirsutum]|nr:MAG: hypothetical protein M1813_004571 [Trichoglossum hirsutum]
MGPPSNLIASLRNLYDDGQSQKLEGLSLDDSEDDLATIHQKQARYEARLDQTIQGLKERVREQEAALERLRSISKGPPLSQSSDKGARLNQLRAIESSFTSLTLDPPSIPPPDSPLAVLLALRHNYQIITETSSSIKSVQAQLSSAQSRLQVEESSLNDAQLMTQGLEARIEGLRASQTERASKTSSQVAKDLLRDLQRRKSNYERETKRLVKAFNGFIDEHLAPMLAAEELGGPVVGGLVEVQDLTLQAGFSQQGKAKKLKTSMDEDKRQRRIDEIWGPKGDDEDMDREGRSEKDVAGAEIRVLTEQLLNASSYAADGGSGAYVALERDSAAARFLVRAKVAQFHPRDATRLRLIDFGKDLDAY